MAGRSTERRGPIIDFDVRTDRGRGGAYLDAIEAVARMYVNQRTLMEESRICNVSTVLGEEEDRCCICQSIYCGGIEMHDRHRDMQLDIDNMSYEELLALEERIGNVSTGLTEESVAKRLKQHKYSSLKRHISMEEEPCCICQEEYVEGDELGRLDCGHDFHSSCIKQWLTHKNLCPICKNTAL